MGNRVQVQGGSLLSNMHFPYHVQLGRHAAIDVSKKEDEANGGEVKLVYWKVSYTVDGSTCELHLKKRFCKDRKHDKTAFSLHDDICSSYGIHLDVRKAETDHHLEVDSFYFCGDYDFEASTKTNRTIHGVTETSVYGYGSGSRGGLLVFEWKKKSGDEKPCMLTVAHYYATSKGDFFDQTRMDIDLSVAVKVTASNDMGFNFTVEGPTQHPAAALFYMFDEVKRTRNWKPTACPHCANIQKQQRNSSMFSQSESEDSDNFPPAQQPRGTRPNAGSSVITNRAPVRRDYTGSFFVRQLFLR